MRINEYKLDKIVTERVNRLLKEDEKMSNHKHSLQTIYDFRFHDSIYMPGGLKEQCYSLYNSNKGSFVLSGKGKSKIGCDDAHKYDEQKLIRIANSLTIENTNLFEILAEYDLNGTNTKSPYIIKKFVVRVPYDSSHSISIVFGVGNKPIIVTAWINRSDDNHENLNTNLYIGSKKERQERVKSIRDKINNKLTITKKNKL